jgi:hypothetical protein
MKKEVITLLVFVFICGCRGTKIWDPPAPKQAQSNKLAAKPIESPTALAPKEKTVAVSARDYYVELRDVNTFNRYYDK